MRDRVDHASLPTRSSERARVEFAGGRDLNNHSRVAHIARRGSTPIHLTHREFEILRYLAERRDHVVHRNELLREVWGIVDGSTTRSVDFAVACLRRKIEPNPPEPRFLRTVHGDGYSLTIDRDA
jgi:DNA-binding response OmpR family regulator